MGHHFSSIAGAGPIIGPIIAGLYFGWFGAFLWIILGSIFIGGVHDFSTLIISIRNSGKSIAEVAKNYLGKNTYSVFLGFIWLSLVYVIAVFADITADTFAKSPQVSQISIFYIFMALVFGVMVYRFKIKNHIATVISLFFITLSIFLSFKFPFLILSKNNWLYILLAYAFIASVLPVWILLQPRDYLSSYLLYFSVIVGVVGLIFGGFKIEYDAFVSFKSEEIGSFFPFLFVTIACGAISGFHSLVASGTTSKQIEKIEDAKPVGYGSMLIEGVVALIALSTVMFSLKENISGMKPADIYAAGFSKFLSVVGINDDVGKTLGFLIISGFVLTTLDTATRIARYIFSEFFGIKNTMSGVIVSTVMCLVLPFILLTTKVTSSSGKPIPCWQFVWPLFGITNQLLAGLVLVIIWFWTNKMGLKKASYTVVLPAVFMSLVTLSALVIKIYDFIAKS